MRNESKIGRKETLGRGVGGSVPADRRATVRTHTHARARYTYNNNNITYSAQSSDSIP